MESIISENITWKLLPGIDRDRIYCDIKEASISQEAGIITVIFVLNFVIPVIDEKHIKNAIINSIPGLSGVKLKYEYDYENLAATEKNAAENMIQRYIGYLPSSLKNAVRYDCVEDGGGEVVVKTFGKMATACLNEDFSARLSAALLRDLGIKRSIVFKNDDENYDLCEIDYEPVECEVSDSINMSHQATSNDMPYSPPDSEEVSVNVDLSKETSDVSYTSQTSDASYGTAVFGRPVGNISVAYGRKITGKPLPLMNLRKDSGEVVIEGVLFHKESRTIKNGKKLVTMLITDRKTSTCLKAFMKAEKWESLDNRVKEGDYILAKGKTEWNNFENALDVMVRNISRADSPKRRDTCERGKRVELHCHTKMSAMDAINEPDRIVKLAAEWGQPAVAITDHGVVQSFPDAASTASKLAKKGKNIKVIYGMEGYVFDDRDCIREDGSIDYKKKPTNHIILLVKSQTGMKNLYKLVSMSHIDYFYKKPRLPKSVIQKYREGLIIGSACEAGEVYRALSRGGSEEEVRDLASFYDYLEIQPLINNQFMIDKGICESQEDLRENNRRIVALADELGKPVVATTDAHYENPESAIYRNIIMMGMGFKDAENGRGLYLRTTDEMLEEFKYLGEETAERVVIKDTNLVASWVEDGIKPVPEEKCPPTIDGAEEELMKKCMDRAHNIYGDPLPERIKTRLDTELNAIISNGYAVMYVSAERLVNKSLEDGYLVGSRGSVGSSFAATMAGITEVNPLEPHYICPKCKYLEWGDQNIYDCGIDMPEKNCPECGTELRRDGFTIPFATFLGFKGNKEPDIDLNFAGEYQARAHRYVGVIFGEENVYKAGTVGTIAEKTAYGYVKNFFDETGRYTNKFEIDRLKMGCTGIKRTTGQHPGGIIIVPKGREIYEFCPVQRPANDMKTDIVTTHFDYHKIDKNLLKLDILGHNVPSMIRQLQDLTGVDPLKVDLTDKKVLSIFNGTEALDIKDPKYRFTHGSYAIPEFGTGFVRQMLDDVKPKRFEDLIRMSGFSHGTDVWLNNAQEYIRNGTATMREAISTRDDIMNYLMLKGIENETAFSIMEHVRKKNLELSDEHIALMKEHGVPDWYIDSCSKIKYMFPRAHAVAYVMMSFRLAWYKVYYPAEFYATYFTSVLSDFDAETIVGGSDKILEKIDNIGMKGSEITTKDKDSRTVLEVAYEMYARGYSFLSADLEHSFAEKFTVYDGRVLLPFAAYDGVGGTAATQLYDAYKEKPFDTIEECAQRAGLGKTVINTLKNNGIFKGIPETAQISWNF